MPKLGVRPNITLHPYLFPCRTEQGVIMWEDFGLGYIHLFEGVTKQYVGPASLVYMGLLDCAVGYLKNDNHKVVLHQDRCLEVICCEGYGRHIRYSVSGDHVDRWDLLKVSFSCKGRGPTPNETSNNGVYNLPCWSRGFSSLSLERLRLLPLSDWPTCSRSLPWLDSSLLFPLSLYDHGLWMNSFKWLSLTSSSILSFRALHSSIEWPQLW